jgi:TnpA family transposase
VLAVHAGLSPQRASVCGKTRPRGSGLLLDGLIRNGSDVPPDTLHGDTQGTGHAGVRVGHPLGISPMPGMRNIRDLTFYRPEEEVRFQNIELLCSGPSID